MEPPGLSSCWQRTEGRWHLFTRIKLASLTLLVRLRFIRSQCSAAVQSKFTFNAFPTTNVLSNLSLKPSFAVPLVWLYEQEATSEVRAAFGERQTEMRSAKNLNIAAHVLAHAERGRRRNITAALQEKRNMQTGKSRSLFRHFLDLASHNSHC